MKNIKVFTGSSHTALTGCILDKLGIDIAPAEVRRSGNAELSVDLGVSVRNEDVYIVQSGSAEINDSLMELLIMVNAAKLASASRITAVLPYL
jgi:ribose-phosphate pyrophosphokinase